MLESMVVLRMGYDVIVVALRCEIESWNGKGCTVALQVVVLSSLSCASALKSRLGPRGRLLSSGLRDLCFEVAGAFRLAVVCCLRQGCVRVEGDRQDFDACLPRCGQGEASVGGASMRETSAATPTGGSRTCGMGSMVPACGCQSQC